MLTKWLAALLRRWAPEVVNRALDLEREDHRATKFELRVAKEDIALLKNDVVHLQAALDRELSRLRAEAAINRQRTVLATELPGSPNHEP